MPSWYRRTRLIGAWVIACGVAGILCALPPNFGDPGSVAEAEIPDPTWTRVLTGAGALLLVLGLLVLLAPSTHRLLLRRRR